MISLSKEFRMVGLSNKTAHIQTTCEIFKRIENSGYSQYIQAVESVNVPYMGSEKGVQFRVKREDFPDLMYGLLD